MSSSQVKAIETARLLAFSLDLPLEIREGLEEHHRSKQDFIAGHDEFRTKIAAFFAQPNALVFGQESADMAFKRFDKAIDALMRETLNDELIVSHGTVISLLLARTGNGDPMEIWSTLQFPDHVSLSWPGLKRIDV